MNQEEYFQELINTYVDSIKDYIALSSDYQDMCISDVFYNHYTDATWREQFRRMRQKVHEMECNLRIEYQMLITLRDMEGLDVLLPKPPEE